MKTVAESGCPVKRDWYRLWLDVWQLAVPSSLACWADNIEIHYDPKTGKNSNTPGVETRVPGWGVTATVEYLDPSWSAWILKDAGNYFGSLVSAMVDSWGYERGISVRAAPFDFRFAPPSQTDYFARLKALIEETRALNAGSPVTLISHSLGGLFALHFLDKVVTAEWKKENVALFLPIATPWAGTALAFNIFAAGYDMGISAVDPKLIRSEQRSYETAAQLLPRPQLWRPNDAVFLSTPDRNFTAANYSEFFEALRFPVGKINLDNIDDGRRRGFRDRRPEIDPRHGNGEDDNNIINNNNNVSGEGLAFPGVKVVCIYGVGHPTPSRLVYDRDVDFLAGEQPSRYDFDDGDGTVNVQSLRLCESWKSLSTPFDVEVRIFDGIDHLDIIKDQRVFDFLESIFRQ